MQKKKMVAPIVITILLVLYLIFYIAACVMWNFPAGFKVLGILILLAAIGVCVFVLVERIKEIRSGEEDDLSKY